MIEPKKLNRRQFLLDMVRLGGAASTFLICGSTQAESPPSPPRNLRIGTSTKAVLGSNDFTFVGAFEVAGNFWGAGLTHRYMSGTPRLYTTDYPNANLLELSVPALKTSAPYNAAPLVNNYGDIYSGKRVTDSGGVSVWGLYWDETDSRMYWIYQDGFNASSPNNACIGYSTLNDTNHTGTGIKAVRLPASIGSKVAKGMTRIPSSFASQYTNGCRLGVGFGGVESAGGTGPASVGPALIAIDLTDITNTPNQGYLTNAKVMVNHPWNPTGRTSPWRARRDQDYYTNIDPGWNVGEEAYGFWQWGDRLRQSGIWIDTPSKQGFLIAARLSTRGGVSGAATQTFTGPTTDRQGTMSGSLPGLAVGEFVQFHATGQQSDVEAAKILSINGTVITYENPVNPGVGVLQAPDSPGQIFRGQFYATSDQWSVAGKHTFFVYDPGELAKGAQGTTPVDLLQWTNHWDVQLPGFSYPLGGWSGDGPGLVTGMTFDPTTNRLYVMYRGSGMLVAVYQVN